VADLAGSLRWARPRALFAFGDVLVALALASSAAACSSSDSTTVTLTGKPPDVASQDAANAICKRKAACGVVEISCSGGTDAATQCSAAINHPDAPTCVAQQQPSIQKVLSCPALTASELEVIQQCVNALATQPCVTQAQADALAMTAEAEWPCRPTHPQPRVPRSNSPLLDANEAVDRSRRRMIPVDVWVESLDRSST
jgi:hypothetical protein